MLSFKEFKRLLEKHKDIKEVSLCGNRVNILFYNGIAFFPIDREDKIKEFINRYK